MQKSDLTASTTVEDATPRPPLVQDTRKDANHLGLLGILAGAVMMLRNIVV